VQNDAVFLIEDIVKLKWKDYEGPNKQGIIQYRISRSYHDNGQLKSYTVVMERPHVFYIRVGTWYLFDKKGSVLKTLGIEAPFKMKYTEIYDKALEYNYDCFTIDRYTDPEVTYLVIAFCKSVNGAKDYILNVYIDDFTGETPNTNKIR
jgi:hypothetical protein